ncbi:DUF2798 domain-containing protein [Ensifer sp.]|uniref:DUF2798 domain-containing protein n=1 Tax=Ensifer sp. TaxID=1872086 RepID=UPI000DDAC1CB|nr:DUF2798 domain-containing protein [Ensifer sp.]
MRKKLPPRYNTIAMPLVLSVLMSCLVSGVSTAASAGFGADMPSLWLKAWGISWLVAFPSLLLVLPLVRVIVGALVQAPQTRP